MSDYADTGTSREGDPYAEIAALKQRVAELERELDAARKVCALAHRINLQEPCDCGYTKERCHNERFKDALAAYRATTAKEPRDEEAE